MKSEERRLTSAPPPHRSSLYPSLFRQLMIVISSSLTVTIPWLSSLASQRLKFLLTLMPIAFMSSRSNARVQASPFSVRLRISAQRVAWFSLRFGILDKCGSCSSTSRATSRTASEWISSPSSSVNSLTGPGRTPGASAPQRPSFWYRKVSGRCSHPRASPETQRRAPRETRLSPAPL